MSVALRTGVWATIRLCIVLPAMSLQFRLPPGTIADFAVSANAPRWLTAFVGVAYLAIAGLQVQSRWVSPLRLLERFARPGCGRGSTRPKTHARRLLF